MRALLIFCMVLVLSKPAETSAQSDSATSKKWLKEVGFVGYSMLYRPTRYFKMPAWQYLAQGIYWKAFKKRNAMRASLSYLNTSYKADNTNIFGYYDVLPYSNGILTSVTGGEATFGYQHNHSFKKFSIYYAMDVNYAYLRLWSLESYGYSDQTYGAITYSHAYGLSQMMGLRIIPHKRLVINIETGARLQMSKENSVGYSSNTNPGGFWLYPLHISGGFVF